MMEKEIQVSIICNAFQHEKYIEEALNSFVMQKTDFGFEVLVHDDASKDHTADVIRKYEEMYPDLIKPIYQTENQFSRGVRINVEYQFPRAKGKYIAFCEGDDYWIDPYKLQKQFDAMEQHPEIDMCATASVRIDAVTGEQVGENVLSKEKCVIPVEQVILGDGGIFATNSWFARKEMMLHAMPFREKLRYDYTTQIQAALRGGILYLPDKTSVYRVSVPTGWTDQMDRNPLGKIRFEKKMIDALKQMDQDTDKKYHRFVTKRILYLRYRAVKIYLRYMAGKIRGKYE